MKILSHDRIEVPANNSGLVRYSATSQSTLTTGSHARTTSMKAGASRVGGGLASSSAVQGSRQFQQLVQAVVIAAAFASVSANSGGTTTNCNPHGNAGCSQWSKGDRLKCTEPDAEIGVRVKTSSPERIAICLCARVCGRGGECTRTRTRTRTPTAYTARFERTTRRERLILYFPECDKTRFLLT